MSEQEKDGGKKVAYLRHRKRGERPKVAEVEWLGKAQGDDERYLVQRILLAASRMRRVPFGSPEWERLNTEHSVLLDVTRDIMQIHGTITARGRK